MGAQILSLKPKKMRFLCRALCSVDLINLQHVGFLPEPASHHIIWGTTAMSTPAHHPAGTSG